METKQCSKCKEVKPVSSFGKRSDCNSFISACRECERERGRKFSAKVRATDEGKFMAHKENAARRGIEFSLTFDQWIKIWKDSGKFSERGRGAAKYCMSRYGDKGAYEVGNVFIQLGKVNVAEGNLGKAMREDTRRMISEAHKGKPHPWSEGENNPMHRPEVKAKITAAIGGANHYKARGVNTPQGFFPTAKAAADVLGMKKPTVEWRARHNKFGFSLPA